MGTTPSRHDHQIKFKVTEDAESAPARFPSSKHVPQNFPVLVGRLPARLSCETVPIKIFVLLDDQLVARHLEPALAVTEHHRESMGTILVHPPIYNFGRDLAADEVDAVD